MVGVLVGRGMFVAVGVFVHLGMGVCVSVALGWGVWVIVGTGVCAVVGTGVSLAGCETAVGISGEGKALHPVIWSRQVIDMTNR